MSNFKIFWGVVSDSMGILEFLRIFMEFKRIS